MTQEIHDSLEDKDIENASDECEALLNIIRGYLIVYEDVLAQHGINLPYASKRLR